MVAGESLVVAGDSLVVVEWDVCSLVALDTAHVKERLE